MEKKYKTLRIIVIVTVSTLVAILTPVDSKCETLSDSFAARSLLSVCPPSESPSPSPAPSPEVLKPANPPAKIDANNSPAASPADSPTEAGIDSPASSPEATVDSTSPANSPAASSPKATADSTPTANSPATSSPETPADSISPANSPAEIDTESPAPSPESSADYSAEVDYDSPAASPESPTNSISPSNPPSSQETPSPSSSGSKLLNTPKNLMNQTLSSPEIKTICSKTNNPSLCESSVTPLLTAHLKPDVSSVLVLAIQASIDATKAAMAIVVEVSADECQELYDDAVTNLEDAINAVKSRDIPTVNTNISAAMTDYGTCDDGFEESGEPNPLGDVSDKLTKMVSNCLAISTLIK
ncbi:unnamed protein product [Cochlearia groenlandica]